MEDLCCTLLRGTVYLREAVNSGTNTNPLLPVGNVTEFSISHEVTEVTQANYQSLGGTACKVSYVESADLNMTIGCLKARNWALATQGNGSYDNVAIDTVTDEAHTVNAQGELIEFANVPDQSIAVEVTDSAGTTTYDEGDDYIRVPAGIEIVVGGAITAATDILVDYGYGANTLIGALTTGQKEFEVVFSGVNEGETGQRPTKFKAYRVKFNPTEEISLLGDEFATLTVTGELLRDSSKMDAGAGQFYFLEFGKVA